MIGRHLVFPFIHRPIHARLEERLCWFVRPGCDKFEKLVDSAFHIAPHERRFTLDLTSPEFQLLRDEKYALLVGYLIDG